MAAGTAIATPLAPAPTYSVSMTAYNAVPEQTDSDPSVTASGAFSNPDIIVARSADLAEELPFGTVIELVAASSTPNCGFDLVSDQVGLRVVADSMHPRKRAQIDILFNENDRVRVSGKLTNPALVMGVCKRAVIRVVGTIDMKKIPTTQQELRLAVGLLEKADEQRLVVYK